MGRKNNTKNKNKNNKRNNKREQRKCVKEKNAQNSNKGNRNNHNCTDDEIDHNNNNLRSGPTNLHHVGCDGDFEELMAKLHDRRLVVVKFYADWCGHCTDIKGAFVKLACRFGSVSFLNVNVETCQNTGEANKVTCLPSFLFCVKGVNKLTYCGADSNTLQENIEKFLEKKAVKLGADLSDEIDRTSCKCLNLSPDSCVYDLFKSKGQKRRSRKVGQGRKTKKRGQGHVESHNGAQLLLSLVFRNKVNLGSIAITAPPDSGPQLVTLYYNVKHDLDFEHVSEVKADDVFELSCDDVTNGNRLFLSHGNSDSCKKVSVYIQNNQKETKVTKVNSMSFFYYAPDKLKKL